MNTTQASKLFEALSSGIRLELFRLLVKNAPDGMVAGDIAEALGLAASNLSFHLKNLTHSGLIEMEKEGRFVRYKANIVLMLDIIAFMTEECCSEKPEQCRLFREQSRVPQGVLPKR